MFSRGFNSSEKFFKFSKSEKSICEWSKNFETQNPSITTIYSRSTWTTLSFTSHCVLIPFSPFGARRVIVAPLEWRWKMVLAQRAQRARSIDYYSTNSSMNDFSFSGPFRIPPWAFCANFCLYVVVFFSAGASFGLSISQWNLRFKLSAFSLPSRFHRSSFFWCYWSASSAVSNFHGLI